MSYSEYKDYGKTQLAKIFKVTINLGNLLDIRKERDRTKAYTEFQQRIDSLAARTRIAHTNEATRLSLLVSPVLIEASIAYSLGLFFEQPVDLPKEETPDLPHPLNGDWDSALTLDVLDFSPPIVSLYSQSSKASGRPPYLFCNPNVALAAAEMSWQNNRLLYQSYFLTLT